MIAGLILICYTLVLAWMAGNLTLLVGKRWLHCNIAELHPVLSILFGLTSITTVLQIEHHVFPVNGIAHFFIWVLIGMGAWVYRHEFLAQGRMQWSAHMHRNMWYWLPLLVVVALVNLIARAGTGDIGDYHLQAIQWNESYPVVKGLGNLRRQLGNNSGWFLLHAFAGAGFVGWKSVYVLNTVVLICGIWYFLPGADKPFPVLRLIAFLYLVLMAYRKYVGAVTNDYAITVFTLIILTEWIQAKRPLYLLIALLLMLPVFKLSAITLLVLLPLIYLKQEEKYKMIGYILVISAMIYLPWIYTNYQLSGYLLYPADMLPIGHPDWQMRPETLQLERIINKANERVPGMPLAQAMGLGFSAWFPFWLRHLDPFSMALIVLSIILPVLVLVRRRNHKELQERMARLTDIGNVALMLVITMVIWFINAPATRFIFGHLVFVIALSAELLSQGWVLRVQKHLAGYAAAALLFNGFLFYRTYINGPIFTQSIFVPRPYGQTEMIRKPLLNGYVMVPPEGAQVWDAPIPSSSEPDSTLQWRTQDMGDGFRHQ